MEFAIFIAAGAFVGFFAGLLGIGGGLILVPILTTVFAGFMHSEHLVHIAIGTSLATILVTSLASVRTHHHHDAVRWDLVKTLSPGIFFGGLLGGWASQFMEASFLSTVFASLEVLIALKMLLNLNPNPNREMPGLFGKSVAGTVIGSISSLVGIGGGALNTPYMAWHNVPMKQAIATSSACSLPVAVSGTLGFIIAGWGASNLPEYSTGFVYWPAFLGITMASVFTAPLGARMTHKLPVKRLQRIFGLLLIMLAIKMFWH